MHIVSSVCGQLASSWCSKSIQKSVQEILYVNIKMAEFSVADWAKDNELSDETMAALDKKGFNSRKSFSKLTMDIIKSEFKNLKPGQIYLLDDAVQALKSPMETVTTKASTSAITKESSKNSQEQQSSVNLYSRN